MDKKTNAKWRPPIVTIMGHVDHGKTTLLDVIRKSNIASFEHGGITQHTGAYQISHNNQLITFIDTPGHAVFEKMRSRGAEVADIVVLVVAANDGVKPQTVEAIEHIKKAKRPIIVAITKVDLENVNIEKVKKGLQNVGVVIEGYGGDVPVCEVSAPNNKGIGDLLEMIELVWQINPQPSLPDEELEAVVIESFLDKRRGSIVSLIVKQGTMTVGQKLSVDGETITVRALMDENLKSLREAGPGKPVEVLGFKNVLEVGTRVKSLILTQWNHRETAVGFEEIIAKSQGTKDKFKILLKADVAGSLEAILDNLSEKILVVSSSLGEVEASDISFAKTSSGLPIIAFNVKVNPKINELAQREGVVIRNYKVIYELLEDLDEVTKSFEEAKKELKIAGRAQIVEIFDIGGEKIAGVKVVNGKIKIGDSVIIKKPKSDKMIESEVISLKKFRKNVESVTAGQECGIGFKDNVDFREGDIVESLS